MVKRLICIILTAATLLLSSCSIFNEELVIPNIRLCHTFENDRWLIVDNHLVDKINGSVHNIKPNRVVSTIDGATVVRCIDSLHYKYEFEESSFKQYTFVEVHRKNVEFDVYCECIITYDYEGKEIDRSYIEKPREKKRIELVYQNRYPTMNSFWFCVLNNGNGYIRGNYATDKKARKNSQAVLYFAENLHKTKSEGKSYEIEGIAKPISEEIWFSYFENVPRSNFNANPLMRGIQKIGITSYDLEKNEYRTVFEHDKKKTLVVDFDEKGAYLLDSRGVFSYVDFATKESSEIYKFTSGIADIIVSEPYICIKYHQNGYTYFVYEKGASVVVNASTRD